MNGGTCLHETPGKRLPRGRKKNVRCATGLTDRCPKLSARKLVIVPSFTLGLIAKIPTGGTSLHTRAIFSSRRTSPPLSHDAHSTCSHLQPIKQGVVESVPNNPHQ